ncbi:MAG: hypothetical protein R3F43_01405 [bacterium]
MKRMAPRVTAAASMMPRGSRRWTTATAGTVSSPLKKSRSPSLMPPSRRGMDRLRSESRSSTGPMPGTPAKAPRTRATSSALRPSSCRLPSIARSFAPTGCEGGPLSAW